MSQLMLQMQQLLQLQQMNWTELNFNTHPMQRVWAVAQQAQAVKPHRKSGRDRTCTASLQTVHWHKGVGKYPKLGCAVKSRMPRIEEDASKRAREAEAATHGKGWCQTRRASAVSMVWWLELDDLAKSHLMQERPPPIMLFQRLQPPPQIPATQMPWHVFWCCLLGKNWSFRVF